MTWKEKTAGNTGLAKVAVQYSADTFVVNQSLVLRINICGENRHLRQARNRWLQLEEKREETKRSSIVVRAKMQRHEKEERDRKQAATNNMYSLCNELF
jgi:hypothetical protein